jgi:hypothetical protein
MASDNKRYALRAESSDLLSYICLDEDGNEMTQGLGRTLDVSERGVKIETHVSIDTDLRISLTIALGDDLMDFNGNIVHSLEKHDGRFEYGIEFAQMDEKSSLFLRQYMQLLEESDNED